jgi:putative tryptophan/tyrosine transport system substrate-binding protein
LNAADPFIISQGDRIVALAARRAIPAVYSTRTFLEAGGLMVYGAFILEEWRVVGRYVGRILNGEKPANLPVQRSTMVKLTINIKAAKALGITVPTALLVLVSCCEITSTAIAAGQWRHGSACRGASLHH